MDSMSNARLSQVHKNLASIVYMMDTSLTQQGIEIRVVQGLRTVAEQNALYAQGRTAPGARVTNAKGGWSAHNFGYACDVVPGLRNKTPWEPNWVETSPDFEAMIASATKLGLISGKIWGDFDHFQLPSLPVTPTDQMRQVLFDQGLEKFWEQFIH